jgi:DNA-binding NarL/FixJ family response regulator
MIKVSIVDDNKDIIDGLVALLKGEPGISVTSTYYDSETAFKGVKEEPVDILIVDINLPDYSGIDLIEKLSGEKLQTQFLVFTVHDGGEFLFKALKAGASGYILKGSSSLKIIEAVRMVHDGGAPMTPSVARKVINFFRESDRKSEEKTLTRRELDVLKLLNQGYTYSDTAEELSLSPNTVHTYIKRIYEKLQASNREEAIRKAKYKSLI